MHTHTNTLCMHTPHTHTHTHTFYMHTCRYTMHETHARTSIHTCMTMHTHTHTLHAPTHTHIPLLMTWEVPANMVHLTGHHDQHLTPCASALAPRCWRAWQRSPEPPVPSPATWPTLCWTAPTASCCLERRPRGATPLRLCAPCTTYVGRGWWESFLCVWACVCAHVCVCAHTCVCVQMHACIWVCLYVWVCLCIFMRVCVCISLYLCVQFCVCGRTCVCGCADVYVCALLLLLLYICPSLSATPSSLRSQLQFTTNSLLLLSPADMPRGWVGHLPQPAVWRAAEGDTGVHRPHPHHRHRRRGSLLHLHGRRHHRHHHVGKVSPSPAIAPALFHSGVMSMHTHAHSCMHAHIYTCTRTPTVFCAFFPGGGGSLMLLIHSVAFHFNSVYSRLQWFSICLWLWVSSLMMLPVHSVMWRFTWTLHIAGCTGEISVFWAVCELANACPQFHLNSNCVWLALSGQHTWWQPTARAAPSWPSPGTPRLLASATSTVASSLSTTSVSVLPLRLPLLPPCLLVVPENWCLNSCVYDFDSLEGSDVHSFALLCCLRIDVWILVCDVNTLEGSDVRSFTLLLSCGAWELMSEFLHVWCRQSGRFWCPFFRHLVFLRLRIDVFLHVNCQHMRLWCSSF